MEPTPNAEKRDNPAQRNGLQNGRDADPRKDRFWWTPLLWFFLLSILAVLLREVLFGPPRESTVDYRRINEIVHEEACKEHMAKTGEVPFDCEQYDYTNSRRR